MVIDITFTADIYIFNFFYNFLRGATIFFEWDKTFHDFDFTRSQHIIRYFGMNKKYLQGICKIRSDPLSGGVGRHRCVKCLAGIRRAKMKRSERKETKTSGTDKSNTSADSLRSNKSEHYVHRWLQNHFMSTTTEWEEIFNIFLNSTFWQISNTRFYHPKAMKL